MSLYLDRHTTYKSKKKLTVEEELAGLEEPMSQFERALKELGVEVILRLFSTSQGADREAFWNASGQVGERDEVKEYKE
tara:strand:- start:195 stop:431 length:237 start_codon:yes stop_codon:yes gene_type:complete